MMVSPKAAPKGSSRSLSAGMFAPPVTGVHQLRVLSSKKRIVSIASTWRGTAHPHTCSAAVAMLVVRFVLSVSRS